jgi:hypothetical protein
MPRAIRRLEPRLGRASRIALNARRVVRREQSACYALGRSEQGAPSRVAGHNDNDDDTLCGADPDSQPIKVLTCLRN